MQAGIGPCAKSGSVDAVRGVPEQNMASEPAQWGANLGGWGDAGEHGARSRLVDALRGVPGQSMASGRRSRKQARGPGTMRNRPFDGRSRNPGTK